MTGTMQSQSAALPGSGTVLGTRVLFRVERVAQLAATAEAWAEVVAVLEGGGKGGRSGNAEQCVGACCGKACCGQATAAPLAAAPAGLKQENV